MAPAANFNDYNVVCVMDASGQLGSALVQRLLKRGYTVHAVVQGQGDDELVSSINGVAFEKKKLKIFHSDPFDYHSIIDALKGCSGLFYSFEPPKDYSVYDEYMAEVEVRAAHNVIEACAQTQTIDKVVFTSSATAVIWRPPHSHSHSHSSIQPDDDQLDERHWSDINFCRKFKLWHGLAKTLAEKSGWALAMDRGVNMVSINAGLLMLPDLSITNPYLKGAAEMYEHGVFVTVDLDFLVDAHICVYEDISSYGRYLCFNHVINQTQDALKLAYLLTPPPQSQSYEEEKSSMRMIEQRISNKKLNKLMVNFEGGSQVD
ncbi:hypothetical protein M9H77_00626 [Catharanthus roseus]|nr:hypothetical protein M9H77_00626 [Catharanthus roseus]